MERAKALYSDRLGQRQEPWKSCEGVWALLEGLGGGGGRGGDGHKEF